MTTCFVAQGYDTNVDLTTRRTLDLDSSYEVIKKAAAVQPAPAEWMLQATTEPIERLESLIGASPLHA